MAAQNWRRIDWQPSNTLEPHKNIAYPLRERAAIGATGGRNSVEEGPTFWIALSALGAAGAAIVATIQIKLSRADARRQAAFAHIREVEARLQRVWHFSVREARDDVLRYHRDDVSILSDRGAEYLSFLSSLDLLLFACDAGSIDRAVASKWLRTSLQRDDDLLQFITDFQQACGDPACYEYLWRHLLRERRGAVTRKEGK